MPKSPTAPLCFVIMPYGLRDDSKLQRKIDFDRVYQEGIAPAVEAAGMEPLRSDLDLRGGVVHRSMFERILLCEYAIADLTTTNPNVMYELGIRHATRRVSTLPIFAEHQPIPFNVGPVSAMPYRLRWPGPDASPDDSGGSASGSGTDEFHREFFAREMFRDEEIAGFRQRLTERLVQLREQVKEDSELSDSPLFQILTEWEPQPLAREKTDTFRDRVRIDAGRRKELERIRRMPNEDAIPELDRCRDEWCANPDVETGSFGDLLLSYRHVEAWDRMIDVVERFPAYLRNQILFREQLGFALNREAEKAEKAGRTDSVVLREQALQVLEEVEERQGPSAETCGLIGRIHKSQWKALRESDPERAAASLDEAITTYCRGSDADLHDVYPAINLATLLDVRNADGDRAELLHRLIVIRRALAVKRNKLDYWDHATLLEAAILEDERSAIDRTLGRALNAARESWEPRSTADNLSLLREVREQRGQDAAVVDEVIAKLRQRGAELEAGQ